MACATLPRVEAARGVSMPLCVVSEAAALVAIGTTSPSWVGEGSGSLGAAMATKRQAVRCRRSAVSLTSTAKERGTSAEKEALQAAEKQKAARTVEAAAMMAATEKAR